MALCVGAVFMPAAFGWPADPAIFAAFFILFFYNKIIRLNCVANVFIIELIFLIEGATPAPCGLGRQRRDYSHAFKKYLFMAISSRCLTA